MCDFEDSISGTGSGFVTINVHEDCINKQRVRAAIQSCIDDNKFYDVADGLSLLKELGLND